jgi:anthranilate phosphoribosyltransferase
LGPLANPAGARAQVMGVYSAHLVPLVAEAMGLLGVRHAFVVHGETSAAPHPFTPGMDELSLSGVSHIAQVRAGSVTLHRLTPEQVGLASAPIESLRGGDAQTNAQILRAVFAGEPGPRRDVVLLNAAAVLITAGLVPSASSEELAEPIRRGIDLAARAIDSGAVIALVANLSRG